MLVCVCACVSVCECAVCAATCRNENYLKWFISQQFSLGDQLQCRFSCTPLLFYPSLCCLALIHFCWFLCKICETLPWDAWHGVASSTCGIVGWASPAPAPAPHTWFIWNNYICGQAAHTACRQCGSSASSRLTSPPTTVHWQTAVPPPPQLPLPAICFSLSQCRKKAATKCGNVWCV